MFLTLLSKYKSISNIYRDTNPKSLFCCDFLLMIQNDFNIKYSKLEIS